MSTSKQAKILIEICSNCKSHQWCTRHNEQTYQNIAHQVSKVIKDKVDNMQVNIVKVGGDKIGSFEIYCNQIEIFSKRTLGYFPHVEAVTVRIVEFLSGKLDLKGKSPIKRYQEINEFTSPAKKIVRFPSSKQNSEMKSKKIQTPKLIKQDPKIQPKKEVKPSALKQQAKKQQNETVKKVQQQPVKKAEPEIKVEKVQTQKPKEQAKQQPKIEEPKQVKVINKPQLVQKEQETPLQNDITEHEQKQAVKQIKQPVKSQRDEQKQPAHEVEQTPKKSVVVENNQAQNNQSNISLETPIQQNHQEEKESQKLQNLPLVQQQNIEEKKNESKIQNKQNSSFVEQKEYEEKYEQNYESDREADVQEQVSEVKKVVQDEPKPEVNTVGEESKVHEDVKPETKDEQNHEEKPQEHVKQEPKVQSPSIPAQKQTTPLNSKRSQTQVNVTIQQEGKKRSTTIQYEDFENEVNRLFERMKVDSSEMIGPDQFHQVSEWFLKQLDLDIPEESKEFFQKYFMQIADKDKDGKLSYEEFKNICWECMGPNDADEEN